MQRRRRQVWHLVCFLAVLLASSFPSLQVLDIREANPEDCFALRQAPIRAATISSLAARTSIRSLPQFRPTQRFVIERARIIRDHLATLSRSQPVPFLWRPRLLRRATRIDAPPADPA